MTASRSGGPSTREAACQRPWTTSPRTHSSACPLCIRTDTPALHVLYMCESHAGCMQQPMSLHKSPCLHNHLCSSSSSSSDRTLNINLQIWFKHKLCSLFQGLVRLTLGTNRSTLQVCTTTLVCMVLGSGPLPSSIYPHHLASL